MTAPSGEAAIRNARQFERYQQGMCLKFVRGEAWQVGALYLSAIDAWDGAKWKHPGDRRPPLGAPCFYRGGQYGHIVVFTGGRRDLAQRNLMRSTDCRTAGNVSEEDLDWPVRTWGQTYLGWTEDLNGVRLPLEGDEEMNEQDWVKLRGIVHDECEAAWAERMTVTQPGTGDDVAKPRQQVLRELWQKVTKAT